jgi:hypothetical protein
MKHIPRKSLLAAFTFIAVALPSWAQAQTLSYDGIHLENRRGVTGNRSMEVRLYTTSINGTIVARETFPSVKITAGKFNIKYGNNGIADKLAGTNWVAVAVAGVELKPRVQSATVPFALHSGDTQALKSRIAALEMALVRQSENAENVQVMAEALILQKYNDYLAKNPTWSTDKSVVIGRPWIKSVHAGLDTDLIFPNANAANKFDEWYEGFAGIISAW